MQAALPLPEAGPFVLANATLPAALLDAVPARRGDLVRADLTITGDKVTAIGAADPAAPLPRIDLDGGMVWPAFVDVHTHLDKGHIWSRRPNPDGTFGAALTAVRIDRETGWSEADLRRRMDFALRSAFAHGTALLRTHLDSLPPRPDIAWGVFAELRQQWAGRIDLQAVSLVPIDAVLDDGFADVVRMVKAGGRALGAATFMGPLLDVGLDRIMRAAADAGLDLDFHVDETEDPQSRSLRHIAEAALRLRFPGRILVGHCCSLALQPAAEAERTLDRVAEAGLAVVSLPMCNLYLQDRRSGRTPRWRGVTLLHEMAARGIPVCVASDNVRDPFFAYGDLDPVEVFRQAVRTLHLDHPFGAWPRIIASTPASVMGHPERGRLYAGMPADLVIFRARDWSELLSRPQADRVVMRGGRAITDKPPDYRELGNATAAPPVRADGGRS